MHIELFSHLTGLAAFHQSALHVLQPGEGKREREGGGKMKKGEEGGKQRGGETETEMFERGKWFEHSTLETV